MDCSKVVPHYYQYYQHATFHHFRKISKYLKKTVTFTQNCSTNLKRYKIMDRTIAVFIPIAFFICVTLCVYFINRFKFEAITKLGGPIPRTPPIKQSWKKIGIVVVGFALGLVFTGLTFVWNIINRSDWDGLFIVGFVSLFVGISLMIADSYDDKDHTIDG